MSQPQPIEKLHTAPGNCRSADSNICADLLEGAVALDGRPGVDDDLRGVGRNGVRDLEIHRRLAARLARLPADQGRGELRQAGSRGEHVQVGLVETVEREEHDRGALAGEPVARPAASRL